MKEDIRKNTEEELRMEDFPDEPQEEGKPEYRAG